LKEKYISQIGNLITWKGADNIFGCFMHRTLVTITQMHGITQGRHIMFLGQVGLHKCMQIAFTQKRSKDKNILPLF